MKIWFDTEFIEDGRTIDLLSIGMVREDGAEFYAECAECDRSRASLWVTENVLPRLTGKTTTRAAIAASIVEFAGPKPEFWAYYADYDWVALCQLFGTMMDLPKGWPMFCLDIIQVQFMSGIPMIFAEQPNEHNALDDARWARLAWLELTTPTQGTPPQ
jgi:hypothetical protein